MGASAEVAGDRATRALTMRQAGATYQQISDQIGYADPSGARAAVKRAMEKLHTETEESQRLEMSRLDRLQMTVWPKAVQGDLDALDRALKIAEARSRLNVRNGTNPGEVRAAFDASIDANTEVDDIDGALVETGRKIADRIDIATATGEGAEITKSLYLAPHLMNVLREMLATPASRKAAGVNRDDGPPSKLASLRALHGGEHSA